MKTYLKSFLMIVLLLPIQLLADGPFLYSLPFNVYPEESILEKTTDKGIDYNDYEDYLLNNQNELGKKVALISGLEVYFIVNSDKKSYFIEYRNKFKNAIEKKYKTTINSNKVPVDIRFIYTLMNDYDTESPKVELYKRFVEENPQSRTIQTVNVFAFNFNLIWNKEKRDYKTLSDFKEKYLDNYFTNFDYMSEDVPAEVLVQTQAISDLGYDCGYNLKCLIGNENDLVNELETKTAFLQHKMANAEPIPMMLVTKNASEIGLNAFQWIGKEAQIIQNLKIADEQKALFNYFVANETYSFINHVDNLSSLYSDLNKSKEDLKKMNVLKTIEKINDKGDLNASNSSFQDLKKIFLKDNQNFSEGNNIDDLRNLFYYLFQNPNELSKIFRNNL